MFHKQVKNILFIYFWLTCVQALGYSGKTTQDVVSTRANTLSDDADDIQRQLDNEARDRMKYGRPQTIWILHYPTKYREVREMSTTEAIKILLDYEYMSNITHNYPGSKHARLQAAFSILSLSKPKDSWKYNEQTKWHISYPTCGGRSQSPVNIPYSGLIHTRAARKMLFSKYNVAPRSMTLVREGETVIIFGDWGSNRPFVYGGAAHSRRYVFHSLAFRRPSEHTVGGMYYPMESQAVHVSAEYHTFDDAIQAASKDKSALLVVASIYEHSNRNHKGLEELVFSMTSPYTGNKSLERLPLKMFSPPLKEYAAYHGSLTTPPCTEAVLWLVRATTLPISRKLMDILENNSYSVGKSFHRLVQPLNDRTIYYFN